MAETLKEKTAKGLFWGVLNNGTMQVLNVVFGIFLARLLSPGDYGLVGMLAIFTAIAGNIQSAGFTNGLINLKHPTAGDYNAVFWFNITASLVMYALLLAAAPLIAAYYRQPALVGLSRFTFLAFVMGAFGIAHNGYMMKNMMNKEVAVCNLLGILVSGTAGIVMALNGLAYWSLAWQQVLYIAVVNAGRYYYTFKLWHPSLHVDFTPIKQMFSFSVKILITTIINSLSNNVLTFIFGRIFSLRTVGSFSQAYKWDTMAYTFVQGTLGQIAQPVMVAVEGEKDREQRVMRKMMRFTAMLSMPVMLGLATVSHEFIIIALGAKWAQSAAIMQILCLGGAFVPFYTVYQNLVISHGRSDIYMWCNVVQLALQVGIILSCYRLGILWLCAIYSVFNIAWLLVWHYYARRLSGVRYRDVLADVLPFFLITASVMAVTYVVTLPLGHLALLLAARVVLGAGLYLGTLKVLRVKIFEEALDFLTKRMKK